MKCDELKPIELECNMGKDINGVEHREPWKAYDIDDVDAAIAELKDKCQMHDFFWEGCGFAKRGFKNTIAVSEAFDRLEAENAELKQKLEDAKATAYAESVDAGMENRKLKRALWMHRAITAKFNKEACKAMCEYNPFIGIDEYKWQEVERKCLAKAEKWR